MISDDKISDNGATLRKRLSGWTDVDVAQYHLGVVLGVLPPVSPDESEFDHFGRCRSIFWSANGLGDALYDALLGLVNAGFLERAVDSDGTLNPIGPFRFVRDPATEDTPGR